MSPHWPSFAPEALAALAAGLGCAAEWLHARRVRRMAFLAFGPKARPARWTRASGPLRVLALSALAWGLASLALLEPRRFSAAGKPSGDAEERQHVVLVLDVSPSMRLVDAGPTGEESRMQRARAVMESFFERVPLEEFQVSVVATYNGAKAVVVDTRDFEVVRNILGDLPLHFAFPAGKTKLLDGLEEAERLTRPWNPGSAMVVLLSDGDTVPPVGMPRFSAAVRSVLVVGVGDTRTGKFIDGRQSRQDAAALQQIAVRLGGGYWDANAVHLPSSLIAQAAGQADAGALERWTRREYALLACALGAAVWALLPLALSLWGTAWRAGVPRRAKAWPSRKPARNGLGTARDRRAHVSVSARVSTDRGGAVP